ncbi:DedA family protein [Neorhizobium alkalisoli]|uniref:Membrane protein DedA with SNARE-associated domain n=1 Tax=Neorhizobium alkalisoli TaxID=528178 RepID=A0A561R2J5_9HYPH|nr:DedA family protein [Neorhizobium alkalisoli]TWF56846.1 membrane protein DedA with SNARE-associated domain [Neorhizobium alkalisoli]
MSLETLISQYGPAAVFAGAAFEGETAAFLGGVFAHRHLMAYWQAALAAGLGSFAADQALFFAGRHAGRLAIVRRFMRGEAASRVNGLLEAHPTGFILAFRFVYGMRTVSPVAIGLSSVPALRFVILNLISAIVWGVVITAVGYLFGNAVEAIFGRLRLHSHLFIALGVIVVAVGIAAFIGRKWLLSAFNPAEPRTCSEDVPSPHLPPSRQDLAP